MAREYPPDTGWGGIGTFTFHLAHGLRELGHDVDVVTSTDKDARLLEDEGIRVHRVPPLSGLPGDLGTLYMVAPNSRHMLLSTQALWQKFLSLHKQNPFDVIDTPELLGEGIFAALSKPVPLVVRLYTPHFKFITDNLHNISPTFDHSLLCLLERTSITSADAVTSPSKDLADFVSRDLSYPIERISIIHNPLDTERFSPQGPKAFESDGRVSVLFVGRLEERKGVQYLVEAIPEIVKRQGPVHFVIIGSDTDTLSGHKSVLASLKESLEASNCLQHVTFIPRVKLEELPSYYRAADICVVPSVYDNSPYTCLEAMSCGRPVIGTTGGGMPEYIGNDGAGKLVVPRDAAALVDAIVKLAANPQARAEMGSKARERVIVRFKRSQIAKQTAELYQAAIASYNAHCKPSYYLKGADSFLDDSQVFLYSYSRSLAEFFRGQSLRDKCRYWFSLMTRPRLFAAKAFACTSHKGLGLLGFKSTPDWLTRLNEKIELHEYPLQAKLQKQT